MTTLTAQAFAELCKRCQMKPQAFTPWLIKVTDRSVVLRPGFPRCGYGLGDYVEAGLSAVGITKARVSRLLGRPCRCDELQAALNRIGQRASTAIGKASGRQLSPGMPTDIPLE